MTHGPDLIRPTAPITPEKRAAAHPHKGKTDGPPPEEFDIAEAADLAATPPAPELAHRDMPRQTVTRHTETAAAAELTLAEAPEESAPAPANATPIVDEPDARVENEGEVKPPLKVAEPESIATKALPADTGNAVAAQSPIAPDAKQTLPRSIGTESDPVSPPTERQATGPAPALADARHAPRQAAADGSKTSTPDLDPARQPQEPAEVESPAPRRESAETQAPERRYTAARAPQTPTPPAGATSMLAESDVFSPASAPISGLSNSPTLSHSMQGPRTIHGLSVLPPAHREEAVQSLVAQISARTLGAGERELHLRLDPPELGSVRISLSGTDGQLTATVTAERADVEQLLRRYAQDLEGALADAGYEGVNIGFGSGTDTPPEDLAGTRIAVSHSETTSGAQAGREIAGHRTTQPAVTGRLDIRL